MPEPKYQSLATAGPAHHSVLGLPPAGLPTVAVFDTGVAPAAADLRPWLVGTETFVLPPDTDHEHGTNVASLVAGAHALNGGHDDLPTIGSLVYDVCGLESVGGGSYISDLTTRLEDALKRRPDIRVWNLSLGADSGCAEQSFSDFAHRLIVELLYYGNYFITDLAELTKRDVEPPNRVVPCWTVHLRGPGWRHDEVFFTPPPLSDTIARWMSAGNSGPYGFLQFQYNPRVTQFLDIGPDRMRAQVTQVLHHASRRALERGDEAVGLRLRDRGVTSFRGAFKLHQRHPAYDPDALNLTSQIEFNPDLLQLLRRPGKRLLWDWSHAEHLWTDVPARSAQHAA